MKTKDYVKKYRLDESDKFNHKEFVSDLTIEFMSLLEIGNARENIKGFENSVRAIRMKWDAVNNKTIGNLPGSLWNYFYATVIVKSRESFFPEEMRKREEKKERHKQDREYFSNNAEDYFSFFTGVFGKFAELFIESLVNINIPTTSFEILGIPPDSGKEDVMKAYRNLSMKYHPDKGGSHEKFIEITEAKNRCLQYLK